MQLTGEKGKVGTVSNKCINRSIVACINERAFDFIGVVLTPWHARMAAASYLKLRSNGLVNSGILLIDRHSKDGYLISPDAFDSDLEVAYLGRNGDSFAAMIQALVCRLLLPLFQSKKDKGRMVYIANPSFPGSIFDSFAALKLDCRFSYILLDEGIGSYLSSDEDWAKQSIKDRGLHGIGASLRSLLSKYEQKKMPKLICELKDKQRFKKFYLFEDDGSINSANASFVKRCFELNCKKEDASRLALNKEYEGAVVYCSQFPLVESGSISLAAHLRAVEVAYRVSKQLEVPFVIKLHPRESDLSIYAEFDACIDSRRGVALEDILGSLNSPPLCISSLCSTAMITATAVFDCCGIGLSGLVPKEEFSASFLQFCEKMNAVFGSYYKRPLTIKEFCAFLQRCN